MKFSYQNMTAQRNLLYGARSTNTSNDAMAIFVQYTSSIGASVGGQDYVSLANTNTDTIYTIVLSKNIFTINGTSTTLTNNLQYYGYNDLLFNFMQNGQPIATCEPIKAKMYYCKIYENNSLVRDFYPVYRKADSVVGLFDIVNKQFYTNSGTGSFTKGPDVN